MALLFNSTPIENVNIISNGGDDEELTPISPAYRTPIQIGTDPVSGDPIYGDMEYTLDAYTLDTSGTDPATGALIIPNMSDPSNPTTLPLARLSTAKSSFTANECKYMQVEGMSGSFYDTDDPSTPISFTNLEHCNYGNVNLSTLLSLFFQAQAHIDVQIVDISPSTVFNDTQCCWGADIYVSKAFIAMSAGTYTADIYQSGSAIGLQLTLQIPSNGIYCLSAMPIYSLTAGAKMTIAQYHFDNKYVGKRFFTFIPPFQSDNWIIPYASVTVPNVIEAMQDKNCCVIYWFGSNGVEFSPIKKWTYGSHNVIAYLSTDFGDPLPFSQLNLHYNSSDNELNFSIENYNPSSGE